MGGVPGNKELWQKVEVRLLQLFEQPVFRAKDITYMMTVMGFCKRRNLPLLYRMSELLHAEPLHQFLTVRQLAKLAETCCILSFFDEKLLQAVGDAVVAELECLSSAQGVEADLSSLIHSFGIMRCRHTEALEKLCMLLLSSNKQGTLSVLSLRNMLMTCSIVSYIPLSLKETFSEVVSSLRSQERDSPKHWLDVVWSAAVLQHCSAEMAESVLRGDFLTLLQGMCSLMLSFQDSPGPSLPLSRPFLWGPPCEPFDMLVFLCALASREMPVRVATSPVQTSQHQCSSWLRN